VKRWAVEKVRDGCPYGLVSEMLGVPSSTIRMWCIKAGVKSPYKSFREMRKDRESLPTESMDGITYKKDPRYDALILVSVETSHAIDKVIDSLYLDVTMEELMWRCDGSLREKILGTMYYMIWHRLTAKWRRYFDGDPPPWILEWIREEADVFLRVLREGYKRVEEELRSGKYIKITEVTGEA
jgi:hypothetical protein